MSGRFQGTEDVQRYLRSLPQFGRTGAAAARFGLEPMQRFASRMGDPQKQLKIIHVAGTNGKGTTCRMFASLFQQAGYRTGLFTSPHLDRFNERIRVDGEMITDEQMLHFFRSFDRDLVEEPLTYFELSTAIAFWHFSRSGCEVAVVETGLGGRLDATNICDPLVSVITSVSEDHTDLLGPTIRHIAREKAGIIKSGRPVVTGPLPDDAYAELLNRTVETGSTLNVSVRSQPVWHDGVISLRQQDGSRLELAAGGRKPVDRYNAAIVLVTTELLESEFPGLVGFMQEAFEQLDRRYPGRAVFEKLLSDRDWFFDGAHNLAAVDSMLEWLLEIAGGREPVVFLSLMKDKATPDLLGRFRHYRRIYYVEGISPRSADLTSVRRILPAARGIGVTDERIVKILESMKTELVIFTGSFYFYSKVQHWIASQPPSVHSLSPHSGS